MNYKPRPGIVLTTVCGESVLAAPHSLWNVCPYVSQINESSAFLWRKLENGATAGQLKAAVLSEFEVDSESELEQIIQDFLTKMTDLGYLVAEQGEDNEK